MLDQPITSKMLAEKDGAVGRIIFNNPARHNAVSLDMWQAVAQIMDDFEKDERVRVIVVTGAGGKAFVSGADISEFKEKRANEEAAAAYSKVSEAARLKLHETLKPTIAMIRGYCIGGGLATAIGCDIRIAAEGSRFGIPAAKLGLGYAYDGIKKLIDLVGPRLCPRDLLYRAPVQRRGGAGDGADQPAGAGGRAGKLRQELLRHDRGQRALDDPRRQADRPRGAEGRIAARHGAVQARRRRVLRQRGLHRGPHRLHGKAPPGVPGLRA